MRCCNCNIEIPSQWKKCFENNLCPNCGGEIFNDKVKTLIDEIAEALALMPNDPQGLAGWLVSNYEMKKIGSEAPVVEFFNGKKKQEIDTSNLKINTNNPIAKFYKNAGLKPPEEYKKIKEQLDNHLDLEQEEESLSVEDDGEVEEPDEDVQKILNVMNKAKKVPKQRKVHSEPEEEDDSDLHPALRADRMERLRKQMDVQNGIMKKGSFSRSD